MLEYLKLENVGPAPRMEVEFAPRVNLITGDNGLGKSFLLDTAWWALTGYWPAEVNRRMTSGLVARPRDRNERSSIGFRANYADESVKSSVGYSLGEEAWTPRGWQRIDALIVYAHADGSFSVWDSARNNWPRSAPPVNPERRPPYVLTETEVWDGLAAKVEGRALPLCNGLLHDWSSWVKAKGAMSKAMALALRALSPDWAGGDRLEPGPTMRLSIDDARDIPSIRTSYAGAVPILHASSGIRRVVALAYMLTWAWSEHRIAAEFTREKAARQVTMLFDEVESHLHPRWQRSILKALRDVGSMLLDGAELQLIASTHAPLVLASAEPWFDPEKDAWLDLDLEGDPAQAQLHRRSYTPRGTPGAWLTSDAFDLETERGSIEAERAVLRARELLKQTDASLEEVMDVHNELRGVLPDIDRFWVRWNAFVEDRGGTP
ncbi:MAG: AAA family ATPase [Acidobacteria bacterium]|nr:AAA family ATPase [Acidobacteriota bacterium]MYH27757.1 AAA family ATPase [Acidobacteriota bacterium]MYK87326.1 AAA family ATPase [Acidobacteriota bacterium]